jgi:hypothetical protein
VLGSYAYDPLGRRIQEPVDATHSRDLYFSANWQVLEERETSNALVRSQNVWSPVYIDAMVLRDRDPNGTGTLSERLYVQQDANFNVTALIDSAGVVQERYVYNPYGQFTDGSGQPLAVLAPDWTSRPAGSSFNWIYLHQGGRYDTVSGLYNFRNRDYSPTLPVEISTMLTRPS